MSTEEKLRKAFVSAKSTFAWTDFATLARRMGYELRKSGKTSGSRRTFFNPTTNTIIKVHEPHDGILRNAALRDLQEHFRQRGLL